MPVSCSGIQTIYLACVLWALYNPIMQYNDRLSCIQNVGQNKTGNTGYLNLDSLNEALMHGQVAVLAEQIKNGTVSEANVKPEVKLMTADEISVYPNPASTQIVIAFKSLVNGVFTLYNSLGDEVLSTSLAKENTRTQLQIQEIANGLYHYEIEFANMKKTIGKITILK